jgi:hypothetical protein
MRKRGVVVVGLVLAAAAFQQTGRIASAQQPKSQAELRKPLVGTWRLVSIEGGATPANRGQKPTGLIYYDNLGNMAAQIMPDRPRPKWTGTPTPEQMAEAFRGYTAYFGTYTIDEKASTVTHARACSTAARWTSCGTSSSCPAIASCSRRCPRPAARTRRPTSPGSG